MSTAANKKINLDDVAPAALANGGETEKLIPDRDALMQFVELRLPVHAQSTSNMATASPSAISCPSATRID